MVKGEETMTNEAEKEWAKAYEENWNDHDWLVSRQWEMHISLIRLEKKFDKLKSINKILEKMEKAKKSIGDKLK